MASVIVEHLSCSYTTTEITAGRYKLTRDRRFASLADVNRVKTDVKLPRTNSREPGPDRYPTRYFRHLLGNRQRR